MKTIRLLVPAVALALVGVAHGQVTMNSTTPGTWIDISATGTPLSLSDDAEVAITTTIGNALLPAGNVQIGSNAAVRFTGAGVDLAYVNAQIPSPTAFSGDQTLMPFWDDINTGGGTDGEIYWEEIGSTLIISWVNTAFYNSPDRVTFQIQVFGSGLDAAQFLYQDVSSVRANNGGSATIGYQAGGVDFDVQWSYNLAGIVNDGDVLTVTGGGVAGGVGTNYCQPANTNSSGNGATMLAFGSDVAGGNPLTLRMESLPQNQFGYFLCSMSQGFIPLVGGGQGNFCMAIPFGRFVNSLASSGAGGFIEVAIDTNNMPMTPLVAVAAGETWYFQGWFRDVNPGNTSNLTDGLEIAFQ